RLYWDGRRFWTRGGFVVDAPAWFTEGLPKFHLDGGIYAGRCAVETVARLAVQNGRWIEGVHTFQVFDAPQFSGTWSERMATVATIIQNAPHARTVAFGVITDRRQVFAKLQTVQSGGGEGLMLRNPDVTHYEQGRTANLLKVKLSHPAFFTLEFSRVRRKQISGKLSRSL
ncbi:MAG: hypothetical protein AAB370_08305, partial [Verrucomicrobiota bacterium]